MKINEFISRLKQATTHAEILNKEFYGYRLKSIKALKRLSAQFDYQCNFNERGQCQGRHEGSRMCCCLGCAPSAGYLRVISRKDAWAYARRFDSRLGFWRPKIGCLLPRELRSEICLRHNCIEHRTPEKDEFYAYGEAINMMEKTLIDDYKNWSKRT